MSDIIRHCRRKGVEYRTGIEDARATTLLERLSETLRWLRDRLRYTHYHTDTSHCWNDKPNDTSYYHCWNDKPNDASYYHCWNDKPNDASYYHCWNDKPNDASYYHCWNDKPNDASYYHCWNDKPIEISHWCDGMRRWYTDLLGRRGCYNNIIITITSMTTTTTTQHIVFHQHGRRPSRGLTTRLLWSAVAQ